MRDATVESDVLENDLLSHLNPCLIHLSQFATLAFSGADALTFLQGQVTCDLRELNDHNYVISAYCNRQGRVLATLFFFLIDNVYYAVLPIERLETIAAQLKKYILLSKVKITDVSAEYAALGAICLAENFPPALKTLSFSSRVFLVWGKHDEIEKYYATQSVHGSLRDWDVAMIAEKFPQIFNTQAGHFVPQHIGLDRFNALSFNKGCYIGQEIIARLQYRGQNKKHLVAKIITQDIAPKPLDNIENGECINVVPLTNNRYAILLIN